MSYFFSEAARVEHLEHIAYYEACQIGLGNNLYFGGCPNHDSTIGIAVFQTVSYLFLVVQSLGYSRQYRYSIFGNRIFCEFVLGGNQSGIGFYVETIYFVAQ